MEVVMAPKKGKQKPKKLSRSAKRKAEYSKFKTNSNPDFRTQKEIDDEIDERKRREEASKRSQMPGGGYSYQDPVTGSLSRW